MPFTYNVLELNVARMRGIEETRPKVPQSDFSVQMYNKAVGLRQKKQKRGSVQR